ELCRHRIVPGRIDARIDGVEDAADQDRPPDDLFAELSGERLDVVESEIGPGAGTVEEEFDHRGFLLFALFVQPCGLTSSPPIPLPARRTCCAGTPRRTAH